MTGKYRKINLPAKVCARCGLSFTWRKKWKKDWDHVRYCSERCRRTRNVGTSGTNMNL